MTITATLARLRGGAAAGAARCGVFEKRLLELLGYGLDLASEADSGAAGRAPRRTIISGPGAGIRGRARRTRRGAIAGRSLLSLARRAAERARRDARGSARALLRAALDQCLEGRRARDARGGAIVRAPQRGQRRALMSGASRSASTSITWRRCARQRGTRYPDPVHAALLAEQAGADNITLHLREDRRHIQERDVRALRGLLQTRMNLEMAATEDDARASPARCGRPTAAWCPSGAPS